MQNPCTQPRGRGNSQLLGRICSNTTRKVDYPIYPMCMGLQLSYTYLVEDKAKCPILQDIQPYPLPDRYRIVQVPCIQDRQDSQLFVQWMLSDSSKFCIVSRTEMYIISSFFCTVRLLTPPFQAVRSPSIRRFGSCKMFKQKYKMLLNSTGLPIKLYWL